MIKIHTINKEDLPELADLYQELAGTWTNLEKMKETYQSMQSKPEYILLGAKLDGKLVGSFMGIVCSELVGECRPFMVIENVIVSNKYRGGGIGRLLMQYMESIARERGCYYIMFVSSMFRQEAHQFYESMGYKRDEVQGFRKRL